LYPAHLARASRSSRCSAWILTTAVANHHQPHRAQRIYIQIIPSTSPEPSGPHDAQPGPLLLLSPTINHIKHNTTASIVLVHHLIPDNTPRLAGPTTLSLDHYYCCRQPSPTASSTTHPRCLAQIAKAISPTTLSLYPVFMQQLTLAKPKDVHRPL
jgi:hypothetical protein